LIGQILLGLEDTMEHMLWIGESMLSRNKGRTINYVMAELDKIQPGDLRHIARQGLDEVKYNLAIVGPISDDQSEKINNFLKL
jgi:hypothetical protein